MTSDEDWRAENDPAERRRIQHRLYMRAFRQRQRQIAGESPKPRSIMSSASQQQNPDDEAESPQCGFNGVNRTVRQSELKTLKEGHDLDTPKELQAMASSPAKRGRGRPRKNLQPIAGGKPVPRPRSRDIQPDSCKVAAPTKTSTKTLMDMFSIKGLSPKQIAGLRIERSK